MYKPSKNPSIEELTKSCKNRQFPLSDLKAIKLENGSKKCIWCLEILKGKRFKWCSEQCSLYAMAWGYPQSSYGLHVLLVRQDFKCNTCKYDYMPWIEESMKHINKYRPVISQFSSRNHISSLLMRVFKNKIPDNIAPEVDHIIPLCLGGTALGLDNHQVLCAMCHKGKTKIDIRAKFAANGNPRKGVKFSESHVKSLSEAREGFDSENRINSREKNLYPKLREPIVAINLTSKEEITFNSSEEAARVLNLQNSNISRVLNGEQNRKQHKGWTFSYL